MRQLFLILVMIMTLGSVSYAEEDLEFKGKKLNRIIFESDIDIRQTSLADALAVMSKSTNTTLVADVSVKEVMIDLYINSGQSLADVLNIIRLTNDFTIYNKTNEILMFTKKSMTSISGKVTGTDGEGVVGAVMTLIDSDSPSFKSSYGGNFVSRNIVPGIFLIKIDKPGYTSTTTIINIKSGQNTTIDIGLEKIRSEKEIKSARVDEVETKTFKSGDGSFETARIQLKHAYTADIKKVLDSIIMEEDSNVQVRERDISKPKENSILDTGLDAILGKTLDLNDESTSKETIYTDSQQRKLVVTEVPKLHVLILTGDSSKVRMAKELIQDLDRPIKQVRITAQVIDTSDNLMEELGFDWAFQQGGDGPNNLPASGIETGGGISALPTTGTAIDFIKIFSDNSFLNLSINLLQKTGDVFVASVPSVVVVNGEEAKFSVTDEDMVGMNRSIDDSVSGRATYTPILGEAGTVFVVTPTIREGGKDENGELLQDTVILDIASEISQFGDKIEYGDNEWVKSKQSNNITTKVEIKDGEVIFIGGLKRTQTAEDISKVPFLGDIPGLGVAFRSTKVDNEVRQIYIQLTAEVVTTENQNDEIGTDKFKGGDKKLKRVYPTLSKTDKQILNNEEGIN